MDSTNVSQSNHSITNVDWSTANSLWLIQMTQYVSITRHINCIQPMTVWQMSDTQHLISSFWRQT